MKVEVDLAQRLPLRILVAEDNAINVLLITHIMQRLGYRVDVAGNGLEVIAALRRQRHDVVLMDVRMPEMDGVFLNKPVEPAALVQALERCQRIH